MWAIVITVRNHHISRTVFSALGTRAIWLSKKRKIYLKKKKRFSGRSRMKHPIQTTWGDLSSESADPQMGLESESSANACSSVHFFLGKIVYPLHQDVWEVHNAEKVLISHFSWPLVGSPHAGRGGLPGGWVGKKLVFMPQYNCVHTNSATRAISRIEDGGIVFLL